MKAHITRNTKKKMREAQEKTKSRRAVLDHYNFFMDSYLLRHQDQIKEKEDLVRIIDEADIKFWTIKEIEENEKKR